MLLLLPPERPARADSSLIASFAITPRGKRRDLPHVNNVVSRQTPSPGSSVLATGRGRCV